MAFAIVDAMHAVRQRTLDLVAHLGPAELERQIDQIMSPLVWDLAHIAAYEDLWLVHRFAGAPLLRPDLAARYDAFETPRTVRGEIELLDTAGAREYLASVRERALVTLDGRAPDPVLHEMVIRHELQHTETMRQAMELGGLLPPGEPALRPLARDGSEELVTIPAGRFRMGAGDGFAYDNERAVHDVDLPAFRIARRPTTNGTWMRFVEGGGYERREWWSDEGWAWKEEYDITHHPAVAAGHPDAPACHVSWFEADAFARAHGARLPTEAEWEKAATWDQEATHETSSGRGALEAAGQVWEWTSGAFGAYPGFVAHPYPQYSQVFFGDRYKVLRGGSWATDPRVATPTFRNWDLPERRQIFAGVRLAMEA
jgi:gamma-glutamyl hercynylcysteine S-oxide synthase